jgi:uncharacterized RDD family membrane protein YckC
MSSVPSDLYSIGWWIESTDDEVYGPASRATLVRFLSQGVISPNTLVRHCTEMTKRPVVDVPGVREALPAGTSFLAHGDRLAEAWPRRKKEQLALAQDSLPCVWKNRPAVLVCLHCGAPYCEKYRIKPFKRQFYFCKGCQAGLYNRRAFAYLLDSFLLYMVLVIAPAFAIGALGAAGVVDIEGHATAALFYAFAFLYAVVFIFRDRLFSNAGPGKRVLGLCVVRTTDGQSPLGFGQAFIRGLTLAIPLFNLIDLSVPYRDPLMRRFGDRWAGTRVIDTEGRLSQIRRRVAERLFKKGVQLINPVRTPLSTFARTVE